MANRRRHPPAPQHDWAYFLDVDGTLIDIADTPDAARVDAASLDLVAGLHGAGGVALALVSGRSLADADRLLSGLQVPLAGQHGLERRDAAGRLHRHAAAPAAMQHVLKRLGPVLARHPALLLENKGLSLALHYRQAPRLAGYLHRLMLRLVAEAGGGLSLQKGKRVLEVKPGGVDKGTAIEQFLGEPPFLGRRPVFIGDDVTDEHGFAMVNRMRGVSIKVGSGPCCARYRLRDVKAVRDWLAAAAGTKS